MVGCFVCETCGPEASQLLMGVVGLRFRGDRAISRLADARRRTITERFLAPGNSRSAHFHPHVKPTRSRGMIHCSAKNLMEFEITWKRVYRIWWELMLRHLLIGLPFVICAGISAGVYMAVYMRLGVNEEHVRVGARILIYALALAISPIPLRFVLNRNFGEFRLALVSIEPPEIGGGKDWPNQHSPDPTPVAVTPAAAAPVAPPPCIAGR